MAQYLTRQNAAIFFVLKNSGISVSQFAQALRLPFRERTRCREILTKPEKRQSMESLRKIKWRDYGRLIISATSAHISLREPVVSLGRCGRCAELVVSGETISRCHCRILAVEDAVYIEDLNSRNGTWVNGTRITWAPLVSGSVVHLGLEQFVFEQCVKNLFRSTFRNVKCT